MMILNAIVAVMNPVAMKRSIPFQSMSEMSPMRQVAQTVYGLTLYVTSNPSMTTLSVRFVLILMKLLNNVNAAYVGARMYLNKVSLRVAYSVVLTNRSIKQLKFNLPQPHPKHTVINVLSSENITPLAMSALGTERSDNFCG